MDPAKSNGPALAEHPAPADTDDAIPHPAAELVLKGETGAPPPNPAPAPRVQVLPPAAPQQTAAAAANQPVPTFTTSEEIHLLIAALAKAQGEFEAVTKDSTANIESKRTGAKFSYSYASLAEVLNSTRPALSKYELALIQVPTSGQQSTRVTTFLGHSSGQWFRCELGLAGQFAADPQELAKAITYLRRITVKAVLGVADEDDDGEGAQRVATDRTDRARGPVAMPQRSSPAAPTDGAATASGPSASPGPVRPSAITIVGHEWRETPGQPNAKPPAPPKRYLLVKLSDERVVCTFKKSIADAVISAKDRGVVFEEIRTSTRGDWHYIEEMLPAAGGQA